MSGQFENNAIFWVEVDKIKPNPYQPRKEFTEAALNDLSESIRMYGVLQPLTVTRREVQKDDGLTVEYELIAGERRLRASKLAGLFQVPVTIRSGPEDARLKLELAIIENLQREDLNPVDRAKAFQQLADEFEFTHAQIAKKVGKSREYVTNSIRLLQLPEEIQQGIAEKRISEGHARPLGMLRDNPQEQANVFKEIILKKLTVRETEGIARRIAKDKVRKKTTVVSPEVQRMEKELSETLGTRVQIEPREVGGKLVIDYFSPEDLQNILDLVNASLLNENRGANAALERFAQTDLAGEMLEQKPAGDFNLVTEELSQESPGENLPENISANTSEDQSQTHQEENHLPEKNQDNNQATSFADTVQDETKEKIKEEAPVEESKVQENNTQDKDEADLYGLGNFSL